MKIGIFTFHRSINYGAVLQAYGLQQFLSQRGHDVYIIDIKDYRVSEGCQFRLVDRMKDLGVIGFIKYQLRNILTFYIRNKRKRLFNKFVEKELRLKQVDVYKRDYSFDAFVFGSDQIWNPIITNGISPILVGRVPLVMGKRILSYAGSVGHNDNLSTRDMEILRKEIQHFDFISVRENSLKEILNTDNVSVVIDPVLLAGKEVFEPLCFDSNDVVTGRKNRYLLIFSLSRDDRAVQIAKKIADEKRLDVIEIISSNETIKNRGIKQTVSVYDIIGYFKNASYVVSTSYHGMVLAILFEKDFNVLFDDDRYLERSSYILNKLGIYNRLININLYTDLATNHIEYSDVNKILKKLRDESVDYLQKALG